jgi:peptidoglycan/LPS O-acetylase OafA/YrhL
MQTTFPETLTRSSTLTDKERLYYLDNLRSFVILLVVVFHVALAFMIPAPGYWPVIDPQQSRFFTGIVLLTDVPIMPIMFMIAGYFGLASLASKGQVAFWRDKLLRVVLPWILGFLIIAPLNPYFWLRSRVTTPPKFSYFWFHMFFTKRFNTQGALWFLGVLTLFYLGLSLAYALYQPLGKRIKNEGPDFGFWLAFLLFASTVFMVVNQFWFDFQWVPVKYVLWVQPTRVSLEAFYFVLGVYAYRRHWFASDGYKPKIAVWLPLALISGAGSSWPTRCRLGS